MLQVKQIKKLLRFLEKLSPEQYSFKYTITTHNGKEGTKCDPMGWLPAVFPKKVKWVLDKETPESSNIDYQSCKWDVMIAYSFFGIPYKHAEYLFCPNQQHHLNYPDLGKHSTKEEFIDMINNYLEDYGTV